jgi:hypothetical protein
MGEKQDKNNIEKALADILDHAKVASVGECKAALTTLCKIKCTMREEYLEYNHREHNDSTKLSKAEKSQIVRVFKQSTKQLSQSRKAFFKAAQELNMWAICKEADISIAIQIIEQLRQHSQKAPDKQQRVSESRLLWYIRQVYQAIDCRKRLSVAEQDSPKEIRQLLLSILRNSRALEKLLLKFGLDRPRFDQDVKFAVQVIDVLNEHRNKTGIAKELKPIIAKNRLRRYAYKALKYDAAHKEGVLTVEQRQSLSLMFVNGLSANALSEILVNTAAVKNVPCLFHRAAVALKRQSQAHLDPVVAKRLLQGLGLIKRNPWMRFKYWFTKTFRSGRENAYYRKVDRIQTALEQHDYLSFLVNHLKRAKRNKGNAAQLSKLFRKALPRLEKRYDKLVLKKAVHKQTLKKIDDELMYLKGQQKERLASVTIDTEAASSDDRQIKTLAFHQKRLENKRGKVLSQLLNAHRYRHTIENSVVRRSRRSHNVNGDGSCLFYAVAFRALLFYFSKGKFDEGFKALFGDDAEIQCYKPAVENAVKLYELSVNDPSNFSESLDDRVIFRHLVKEYFRPRVVDYEEKHEFHKNGGMKFEMDRIAQEENYWCKQEDLNYKEATYYDCMKRSTIFGGQIEIAAMAKMLGCQVKVFIKKADGERKERDGTETNNPSFVIRLLHTKMSKKSKENDHYHFYDRAGDNLAPVVGSDCVIYGRLSKNIVVAKQKNKQAQSRERGQKNRWHHKIAQFKRGQRKQKKNEPGVGAGFKQNIT